MGLHHSHGITPSPSTPTYNLYLLALWMRVNETSGSVDQSSLHGSPPSPRHRPLPLHPLPTPHWYQAIPTCIMDESNIWKIWLCRPVRSAWVSTIPMASPPLLHPLPTPHWYQAIPTCIMDESKIWNIWLCRPVWSAWVSIIPMASPPPPPPLTHPTLISSYTYLYHGWE